MRTSEQINEIAAALSKAQAIMRNAPKDRVNPHFKNRYSDLAAMIDTARAPLTSQGISWTQGCSAKGRVVHVVTRLMHVSGQWIEDDLELEAKDPSPQAVGSALTYARRYSFGGIVGMSSDDDDDGERAQPAAKDLPKYSGAPAEKVELAALLKRWGVPQEVQGEISKRLIGKVLATDAWGVVQEVRDEHQGAP